MVNKKMVRVVVLLAVLGAAIFFIWYNGYHQQISLASFRENKGYLESMVVHHYVQSVLVYILLYAGVLALAIPGVPLLTLVGGFFFGFIPGGFYALVGALVGTSTSFLCIRYFLSNVIRGTYAQKLEQFNKKIASQGVASYLLTLHLVGLIPYFVINTLAALAGVSFTTFFWTTAVGSVPIIFIYAFGGRQLYFIESVSDVFSTPMIVLMIIFIMLSLLPMLCARFRSGSVDADE